MLIQQLCNDLRVERCQAYLVKVLAAPIGSRLASVPVKDAEEALILDSVKVVEEAVGVLRQP